MFLFKPKKPEEEKKPEVSQANIDLEIITNMNQEFAVSRQRMAGARLHPGIERVL